MTAPIRETEEKRVVNVKSFTIEQIGVIRSCYSEKFGIPRQPGMVFSTSYLELFSPYSRPEMVKELDQFSHIWVHFIFHDSIGDQWKPTVRPPGLGGQQRVGVFSSRSPHRPNHLGLSVVQLLKINYEKKGVVLELGGGDFLDNTPVIDIKPYVPFSDIIPTATGGYSGISGEIEIVWSESVLKFCESYQKQTKRDIKSLIHDILKQDPRPASQRKREKEFGMQLWDVNIRWLAKENSFFITECRIV